MVPVPAFAHNGMENWGLIIVDASVYYLPYRDDADSLVLLTVLLAHEIAHTVRMRVKLQALVYDILPSTTAVFSYAIGSRKLSANEQFFLLVFKE